MLEMARRPLQFNFKGASVLQNLPPFELITGVLLGTSWRSSMALFLAGAEVPVDFAVALLVFLPKVELAWDEVEVVRESAATRPLGLMNIYIKLAQHVVNHGLTRHVARHAHPAQRGFVAGRQLVAKAVELVGEMRCLAMRGDTRRLAVAAFFDLIAAFPSADRGFLMSAMGGRRHGRRHRRLRPQSSGLSAGVLQGSPLSGTLFVMWVDSVVSVLVEAVPQGGGLVCVCAFAPTRGWGSGVAEVSRCRLLSAMSSTRPRLPPVSRCMVARATWCRFWARQAPASADVFGGPSPQGLPCMAGLRRVRPCEVPRLRHVRPGSGRSMWVAVLSKGQARSRQIVSQGLPAEVSARMYKVKPATGIYTLWTRAHRTRNC